VAQVHQYHRAQTVRQVEFHNLAQSHQQVAAVAEQRKPLEMALVADQAAAVRGYTHQLQEQVAQVIRRALHHHREIAAT
jgi:hypothetical protein